MGKEEYLRQLPLREWMYNVDVAYVYRYILPSHIDECSNSIQAALKYASDTILEVEMLRKRQLEIEDEEKQDWIMQALPLLKYVVHGDKTRAYYRVSSGPTTDTVNDYLIETQFRQYLWRNDRTVFSDSYYQNTLRFLKAGVKGMKTIKL